MMRACVKDVGDLGCLLLGAASILGHLTTGHLTTGHLTTGHLTTGHLTTVTDRAINAID